MHFRKLQSGSSSVVWIDLVLLIYSSIDGHLGYFHFLTLEEDAAMNMGIQISLFDSAFHFFFFHHGNSVPFLLFSFFILTASLSSNYPS